MKIAVSYLKNKNGNEKTIEKLGHTSCDYIHIDLTDGLFAGEKNYQIDTILQLFKNVQKPLDIHLMVKNPKKEVEAFAILNPAFITVHLEIEDLENNIKKIKGLGISCGIAVDKDTSIEKIYPYLKEIDLVLIMSVKAGFGGQSFQIESLEKVKALMKERKEKNLSFKIAMDGGINDKTIKDIPKDIDLVVSGSFVCLEEDYEQQIEKLKKAGN